MTEQQKLMELYRELGYLQAKIDSVKRRIAYMEKASVPTAPSDEPMLEDEKGEGQ